jgi:single-stranded DNA-binding protein
MTAMMRSAPPVARMAPRASAPPQPLPQPGVVTDLLQAFDAEIIQREPMARAEFLAFRDSGYQEIGVWRQALSGGSIPGKPLFDLVARTDRRQAATCWLYHQEVGRQLDHARGAGREALAHHLAAFDQSLRDGLRTGDLREAMLRIGDVLVPFLEIDERQDGFHGRVKPGHQLMPPGPQYHLLDADGVLLQPQRPNTRGVGATSAGEDLSHTWLDCDHLGDAMPLAASALVIAGNLEHAPRVRLLPGRERIQGPRATAFFQLRFLTGNHRDSALIDVRVYGRQAEVVGHYLVRGSACVVDGDLIDEQVDIDGRMTTRQILRARRIQFLGRPRQTADQARETQAQEKERADREAAEPETA